MNDGDPVQDRACIALPRLILKAVLLVQQGVGQLYSRRLGAVGSCYKSYNSGLGRTSTIDMAND